MEQIELAYFAGFFDGEGSVSITKAGSKNHYRLQCGITQTNHRLLILFKDNFGGGITEMSTHYEARWGRKQCWRWWITDTKAGEFLSIILPYLKLKKGEAQVAIEFLTTRTGHRGNIPTQEWEVAIQETYISRLQDARILSLVEEHKDD